MCGGQSLVTVTTQCMSARPPTSYSYYPVFTFLRPGGEEAASEEVAEVEDSSGAEHQAPGDSVLLVTEGIVRVNACFQVLVRVQRKLHQVQLLQLLLWRIRPVHQLRRVWSGTGWRTPAGLLSQARLRGILSMF